MRLHVIFRVVLLSFLLSCMCVLLATTEEEGNSTRAVHLPSTLKPLIPRYPIATERALKALKRGVENYVKGQFQSVLGAMPESLASEPTAVADYILSYRAKANLALERTEDALRDFRLLKKRFPDSSLVPDAVLGECQALLKMGDPKAAISALLKADLEENGETLFFRGRASEAGGDLEQAILLYLRVFADYVNSKSANLAERRLLALSSGTIVTKGNYPALFRRADNLLRAGKNRDARTLLLKLAQIPAPDKLTAEKRSLLFAEVEFNLGKAAEVLPHLEKVSAPSLLDQSMYFKAACSRRLGKEEDFLRVRDQALRLYPHSPFTEKILYSVATYHDIKNQQNEAFKAYQAIVDNFPKGEYLERSLWKMAVYAYSQKRYDEALKGFWRHLDAYPNPRSAAASAYWMGRCCQMSGDFGAASSLYQRAQAIGNRSYYGQRAREAELELHYLGSRTGKPITGFNLSLAAQRLDGIHSLVPSNFEPTLKGSQIIERARQLLSADLKDLALAELRWAIRRYPEDKALSYVVSRVHESKEDFYEAIVAMRRAFPDYDALPAETLPEEVWGLLFPVRHRSLVSSQARKLKIDPNLVLGLIRQESAFKESARSSADARGLMQVLPATGKRIARQAGVSGYTVGKLYQADVNIALGTHYLASLLRKYGTEELALAAYNAGDTRVNLWIKQFGTSDKAEFVELIPFSETRSYVKQVLTSKVHYGTLTPAEPASD